MNVEERMQAAASRFLWCVHVIGPDDVYAEPSYASTVENAEKLNKAVWSSPAAAEDVACFAFADIWPWSAEAHAEDIARQADERVKRHAARSLASGA